MTLATDLELPELDAIQDHVRGPVFDELMSSIDGYDGWLARSPLGFVTLDRESGEFFLRSRAVMFPSMTLAAVFNITEGPLYEEISKNLITRHGDDHRRLRGLVNPALAPRRADTYRPALRALLTEVMSSLPESGPIEFIAAFAKPYTSRAIAYVLGAPDEDAPKLHYWSNLIQRQFDPMSLMDPDVLAEIEQGVVDCYAYIDALIETRRVAPGDNLITCPLSMCALTYRSSKGRRANSYVSNAFEKPANATGHQEVINFANPSKPSYSTKRHKGVIGVPRTSQQY